MEKKINAAAYVRVSTEDQTEYSPSAQLKAIKDYAERNNMCVTNIYSDEGISGRTAKKRPGFMDMVMTAKKHKGKNNKPFDVILVHKFDRFSRNREESIVYKSMLRKECGVKVVSITEHIEDDKFSVILEAMLEAMAEYYSLNLSDEVKKGMTEKAERGEYMTAAPFGYEWKDGKLLINEEEAKYVKYIFESFESGAKNKTQLARELNGIGIKTHRGNKIELRTIDYILKNITYKGYVRWCTSGKQNYRISENNENTIIRKGVHQPIVSEELFDRVQKKLAVISESSVKRTKETHKYWLSGIIKCGSCGASLTYVKSSDSLQCVNYQHAVCRISHSIKEHKAKAAVLAEFTTISSHINLNEYIRNKTPINDNIEEQTIYTRGIEKLNSKLERLKEAYLDGVIDLSEYKIEKEKIINRINIYNTHLNEINSRKSDPPNFKQKAKDLMSILNSDNISENDKNFALRKIFQKIVYNKPQGTFEFYYYY